MLLLKVMLFGLVVPTLYSFRVSPLASTSGRVLLARPLPRPPTYHLFREQQPPSQISSKTRLAMFLPPSGGGGGGGKKQELGELATAVLTFLGVALFFASPLGGIFFALFNSLLAISILLPIGGFVAFNIWQFVNTTTGPCPNCGVPVRAMKDGSPSFCFNCGSILQSKDGKLYLANPNVEFEESPFVWLDELGGVRRTPVDEKEKENRIRREQTIIDVDVEKEDK